jgi:hypothetical protein
MKDIGNDIEEHREKIVENIKEASIKSEEKILKSF